MKAIINFKQETSDIYQQMSIKFEGKRWKSILNKHPDIMIKLTK